MPTLQFHSNPQERRTDTRSQTPDIDGLQQNKIGWTCTWPGRRLDPLVSESAVNEKKRAIKALTFDESKTRLEARAVATFWLKEL